MFSKKCFWVAFLGICSALVFGQTDTVLLTPEVLGAKDIQAPPSLLNEKVKIISGSRFPVEAGDLPFSVYVITKEEIRLNGYETLVDALKMVPGIRVSQPGSALEGETFQMRGLLGNTYAKILINDVPIKPTIMPSMPIGAQLPIKEAERIEIIFGAGAALYGTDASAGIINIITKDSEKPVFMQADLALGGNKYSSTGVMFGGKLGKDKRIIKYFFYGSNLLFDNRKTFYDRSYNYNPANYPLLVGLSTFYDSLANYSGEPTEPLITSTPHLSRKMGFQVKYKRLTFSTEIMYRRDHSSIGLNPAAVSYRDPLTYTGEGIQRYNLQIFKEKTNKNRKTDITFLRYAHDDRSSNLFVMNNLAAEFQSAAWWAASMGHPDSIWQQQRMLFDSVYQRYLNGPRYMVASAFETRLEHVRSYRLFERFSLTVGGNVTGNTDAYVLNPYLPRPLVEGLDAFASGDLPNADDVIPLGLSVSEGSTGNAFGQVFYNSKKLNLLAAVNGYFDDLEIGFIEPKALPRLAGLWNFTERANVRLSWGKSIRAPNAYFRGNNLIVEADTTVRLLRAEGALRPEVTRSWEGGLRLKSERGIAFDFTYFINDTEDLITYTRVPLNDFSTFRSFLGYQNIFGSSVRYQGGQLFLVFSADAVDNPVQLQYNYSWVRAKQLGFNGNGDFYFPGGNSRLHQIRGQIKMFERAKLIVDYLRLNRAGQSTNPDGTDSGYRTWDVMLRFSFTDRFDAYFKVINLFNKEYAGIPASRSPNDLHYNPQSGFFGRVGMNYFIE